MASPYGHGQGPPGGYGGQPPYQGQPGAPGYGGQAPGQPAYGQPGYGAQPPRPGYGGAPGQPGYGAPGQPAYGAPPQGQGQAYTGQPGYAPPGSWGAPGGCPPGVDPQVFQWFQTVDADKSGKITALELQQALVNANWSHFNPEACRLMIGLFDRDMSGTIDLSEFSALWNYIQQWRGVFERIDANRSGAVEMAELQQAYQQMGYNLSPNFAQLVIYKYDVHGRRSLTLDGFIQSCVLLKSLTDVFKQKDTSMCGTINISYEDFMCMALMNKP